MEEVGAVKNTIATVGSLLVIGAICIMVYACSALGLAQPKGFDQQLAEAYGVHTAVIKATTDALQAGTISSTEATQVQTQAVSSRSLLDTAKSIEQSNPAGASSDLALATASLGALQTFLNGRKK